MRRPKGVSVAFLFVTVHAFYKYCVTFSEADRPGLTDPVRGLTPGLPKYWTTLQKPALDRSARCGLLPNRPNDLYSFLCGPKFL